MGVKTIRKGSSVLTGSIGFLLAMGLLISCATQSSVKESIDERTLLQQRVEEYWQYQIGGDIEKAYQCEAPEFRQKVSFTRYINRFKLIKYLEAKVPISTVEIDGDRGKASVQISYKMLLKRITEKNLERIEGEEWRKVSGVWYHVPEG
jgi:hypothetical protein